MVNRYFFLIRERLCFYYLLLTLQINTVLPMYQQCLDLGQQPFLLQLEHSVTQDTLTVKVLRPIYQLYNLEIKRNAIAK